MLDYRIRQATAADASVIARHRVCMFTDMGELGPGEAPAVESASCAPRASLHASDAGRAVYERLGFASSNEMRVNTGTPAITD